MVAEFSKWSNLINNKEVVIKYNVWEPEVIK